MHAVSDTLEIAGRESPWPLRMVTGALLAVLMLGTAALMAPAMAHSGHSTAVLPALFTATSALCVTGLQVLPAEHWTSGGYVVIMILIQIGGLGVMTLATLIGATISKRVGTKMGLSVLSEHQGQGLGGLPRLLRSLVLTTLLIETVTASVLCLRLWLGHGKEFGAAAWEGLFLAVSSFNNAGFALSSDSLIGYADDPMVLGVIGMSIVLGGIGFPVLVELARMWWRALRRRELGRRAQQSARGSGGAVSHRALSTHSAVTIVGTVLLIVGGAAAMLALEWTNPRTLGPLPVWEKILGGVFHSITLRTAGFNALAIGDMRTQSWLVSDVLMFIGGGTAGTAGGIKVTTFALVGLILWAQIRGTTSVHLRGRSVSSEMQRQAVTVALLAVGVNFAGCLALAIMTPYSMDQILYEVTSAFGTVGVTTGITPLLPADAQLVVIVLMIIGRLGPVTVAGAFALRGSPLKYTYPEDRVLVG